MDLGNCVVGNRQRILIGAVGLGVGIGWNGSALGRNEPVVAVELGGSGFV